MEHITGKAVSDFGTQEEWNISFIRKGIEWEEYTTEHLRNTRSKLHWRETNGSLRQASILRVESLNGCSFGEQNGCCLQVGYQKSIHLCFWIFFLIIHFIFGCARSRLLRGLFSRWGERGIPSSPGAQASQCGGFSYYRARALECQLRQLLWVCSAVVALRL